MGYTASNKRYIAVTRHIWGTLVEFIFVACDFKVYTPARGRGIKKAKSFNHFSDASVLGVRGSR